MYRLNLYGCHYPGSVTTSRIKQNGDPYASLDVKNNDQCKEGDSLFLFNYFTDLHSVQNALDLLEILLSIDGN